MRRYRAAATSIHAHRIFSFRFANVGKLRDVGQLDTEHRGRPLESAPFGIRDSKASPAEALLQ
jgi:hypothetical protein